MICSKRSRAKRGSGGELLSVHSGAPLHPNFWDVVEERAA
jgi:hypothetical protein